MYKNKLILAPMVRLGILPMRLMALKYGADLVFTPELIDKKLIKTSRIQNGIPIFIFPKMTIKIDVLGTVDFIESDTQKCCLRIHPTEKSKLILQIGTADPVLALQAALKVADDVVGVDVNCGCPKKFSVAGIQSKTSFVIYIIRWNGISTSHKSYSTSKYTYYTSSKSTCPCNMYPPLKRH